MATDDLRRLLDRVDTLESQRSVDREAIAKLEQKLAAGEVPLQLLLFQLQSLVSMVLQRWTPFGEQADDILQLLRLLEQDLDELRGRVQALETIEKLR